MSGAHAASGVQSQADALIQEHLAGHHRRPAGRQAIGPTTVLCASGRGGTGTTLVSALLSLAAAGNGQRVLLIDADDLVGPIAMLLGVSPHATWQDLRGGKVQPSEIAIRVSATLTLVAGGAAHNASVAASVATHALSNTERKACMRRLSALTSGMDLVVIDCGSRLDTINAAITPHSGERLFALSGGSDPVGLASTYALCKAIVSRHSALPVEILVNRNEGNDALRCFDTIDAGMRQFLEHRLHFAGAIPADPTLDAALHKGMPFPEAAVGSPSAIAAHDVVTRLFAARSQSRPGI